MKVHSGLIFPNLLVVSIYILPIVKKFKHFFCLWFFGFLLCPFFCWNSHWLLVSLQAFLLYSSDYSMLVLYTNIFMIFLFLSQKPYHSFSSVSSSTCFFSEFSQLELSTVSSITAFWGAYWWVNEQIYTGKIFSDN